MIKTTEKLKNLVKEIENKVRLGLSHSALRAYVNEITKKIQEISESDEELVNSLQTENEQLKLSLEEAQNQQKSSAELQSGLEAKEEEASQLQSKLTEAQGNVEKLKQEISDLAKQIEDGSEKEILKNQLEVKENQLQLAESNVKLLQTKRNSLNEQISRLQGLLIQKNIQENNTEAQHKDELNQKELEIDELRKKLAALEAAEENKRNQLKQISEKKEKTRDEINTKLDLIEYSIASPSGLSAEELTNRLTQLREMKNLLTNGTDYQKEIIAEEQGRLKKDLRQLKSEENLRNHRSIVEQRIADALADKGIADAKKRIKIEKGELLDEKHRNYSETLKTMNSSGEIASFEKKILETIAGQRNEYETILEALVWAKEAIKNKNVGQAKKSEAYLSRYRKLQLEQKEFSDDYDIFLNKFKEFYVLKFQLLALIYEEEATAQIEENPLSKNLFLP